jgi:predicted CoA-substrate-specific enzyme activase
MYYLGVDIGAATAKAVIIQDRCLCARALLDTGPNIKKIADKVAKTALAQAGIGFGSVQGVIATGYGRISVDFADKKITEITCHAKGVHHLMALTRTIIDIGGQDSKAIRINEDGNVIDFVMNDKCAAGTGRFLEVIAKALEIPIAELGTVSLQACEPCAISSVCTVFAESEVVSLRAEGASCENIVAGIHKSIASRIRTMLSQVGHENRVVLTGGVAQNTGLIKALESELNTRLHIPEYPQFTGALGAALIAAGNGQ